MIENPSRGRATITDDLSGFRVELPTKKNWFIILFLCFWFCGWIMGESFAIGTLFKGDTPIFANLFMLVWLGAWTTGGVAVVSIILWQLKGKETIVLENNILTIEKNLGIIKRKKQYDANQIENLKLSTIDSHPMNNIQFSTPIGNKAGKLCFSYGMKTVRFLMDVDEAEAQFILDILLDRKPFKKQTQNY